jgi:hypothetical protein
MTDREHLLGIGGAVYAYKKHSWKTVDSDFVVDFVDAILAAGFGDVVQCTEDYERGVFKLAKRIVMLTEYCVHTDGCILSQWREGKPTEDGGYESLYGYGTKEKWYKRDEEPKCTCGLSDLMGEGKDGGE